MSILFKITWPDGKAVYHQSQSPQKLLDGLSALVPIGSKYSSPVDVTVEVCEGPRELYLHDIMMQMPEGWRGRWCSSGPCGCMGASNCSGRLSAFGINREQWQQWKNENPDCYPQPQKPYFSPDLIKILGDSQKTP